MKRILLTTVAFLAFTISNAQKKESKGGPVSEGKWLIEANTGFGSGVGSTRFELDSVDGDTAWNLGAEGGYFIIDNLALKLGLGYGDDGTSTAFAYKVGAKYYIIGKIPVEVSYNGASIKGASENPSYVGVQAGYALFLSDSVSLEPGIRYNNSLNDDLYKSALQVNIGFALHF